MGSAGQGASTSPGALVWEGARYGAIEDCVIAHVGLYGIEIGPGCEGIRVEGNEIVDVGGGGIKIGGDPESPELPSGTGCIGMERRKSLFEHQGDAGWT